MKEKIIVHNNKSFRLEDVIICDIIRTKNDNANDVTFDEDIIIETELEKMNNELRIGGANQIGPLIQHSSITSDGDCTEVNVSLMLQADRYINNVSSPFRMEPIIKAKDCMYTRFVGMEEDIHFAYQKIAVTAYEEDIKLKGSCYTIFLDSNNDGTVTADIFIEKE